MVYPVQDQMQEGVLSAWDRPMGSPFAAASPVLAGLRAGIRAKSGAAAGKKSCARTGDGNITEAVVRTRRTTGVGIGSRAEIRADVGSRTQAMTGPDPVARPGPGPKSKPELVIECGTGGEFNDQVYDQGQGREQGRKGGRKEGREDGTTGRRDDGTTGGRKDGRKGGREEGRKGGREEGRKGGREGGRKEGRRFAFTML